MSTPRYRSEPPSRSGSAISVSTATTPSSPGLKSFTAGNLPGSARVPRRGAPGDTDPRRRHGAGVDRGDASRPGGDRRRLRMGHPGGRGRRDGALRRKPAARARARLDQANGRGAQGADHDPRRRRLPLRQRHSPQDTRPLRPGAAVQELRRRALALRGRRPDHRARGDRGPLRGDRVRGGIRSRRRARRVDRGPRRDGASGVGDLDQAAVDRRRPPEGHGRPQGQHHEVLRRTVPARRARGRGGEPRPRVRGPHRGQPMHAARAAAGGIRRAGAAEPLRRHRLGPRGRARRRPRSRAGSELRHARGGVRADARLGAEVRGPEQGQPDGDDALGGADAPPPRGARGSRPARERDRGRDPRRRARDLRHETEPRRPHRRGYERRRRRDHRRDGSARVSQRRKVTVVGAGNVGATCAQVLATRDYADVVLVVITAGLPRSPGMSRDDLVTTNEKIVGSVTEQVVDGSPDAVLIIVSIPLDAMCHVAKNVSAWPKERVFGMAGILDTARFSTFIAWETGSSVKDVTAMVLGGHGDQMVPVVSATTVGGIPLRQLVAEERIEAMVERTAKGGGEIVNLLGTSAWYAPGAAAAQMVDAVVLDEHRVLPCTAYLEGEYKIDGLYMGVPVKLGAGGIEEIVELELGDDEGEALNASAEAVREVVGVLAT